MSFRLIELKKIRPSKLNPRSNMNLTRISELAASIREVGLLEPIIVRPIDDEFEVVVGERRYRASQQAGLEEIPAIIREYSDDEVVQLNLIENVQREELSAIEKGKVCKYLLEECPDKYSSRTDIAKKIGVSPGTVSLWMKTAEVVPYEVREYVSPADISGEVPEGKIDYATAVKVGRSIEQPTKRIELIKKLAERRLSPKERSQVIERTAVETDKPIETVIEEVEQAPYELRFAAVDWKPLVDGTKTQVSSFTMPDPKVKTGAIVHATISEPHIADLRILSIERKRLKYFGEDDAKREGGYTLHQLREIWKEMHGEWDEDQLVYVVRFEKLNS